MEFAHIVCQGMMMAEKAFSPAGCPGLLASVNAGAIHPCVSVHFCYYNRILEAGRHLERLLR